MPHRVTGVFQPIERLVAILDSWTRLRDVTPTHSIGYIDSRMWDPVWRGRYGASYTRIADLAGRVMQDENKGLTAASQESYGWGRGLHPVGLTHVGVLVSDWVQTIMTDSRLGFWVGM